MKAARCLHQAACLAINYRSSSYVVTFIIDRHSAIHLEIYHSHLPLSRIFLCFFLLFFSQAYDVSLTKIIIEKTLTAGFQRSKILQLFV